jgi:hypothetical protein
MVMPNHEGLRVLLETVRGQRPVVSWRDHDGTEAVVFDDTIAAAVPGGLVHVTSLTDGSFRREVRQLAVGARGADGAGPRREVILVPCGRVEITRRVAQRLHAGDAVPVEEFYGSPTFRASLAHAKALAPGSHIRLLSAYHGLLPPFASITRDTADDVPLGHLPDADLRAWGWRIVGDLLRDYGTVAGGFVLLGGPLHQEVLMEAWPRSAPYLRLVVAARVWPTPDPEPTQQASGASGDRPMTEGDALGHRQPTHEVSRASGEEPITEGDAVSAISAPPDEDGAALRGQVPVQVRDRAEVMVPKTSAPRLGLGGRDACTRSIRLVRECVMQRSPGHNLRNRIIDALCHANGPLSASTIVRRLRQPKNLVRDAIGRLVDAGIAVPAGQAFVMRARDNRLATTQELAAVLALVRRVMAMGDNPGGDVELRKLEATFAANRPTAFVLQAVLSRVEGHIPPSEQAVKNALGHLRNRLIRRGSP